MVYCLWQRYIRRVRQPVPGFFCFWWGGSPFAREQCWLPGYCWCHLSWCDWLAVTPEWILTFLFLPVLVDLFFLFFPLLQAITRKAGKDRSVRVSLCTLCTCVFLVCVSDVVVPFALQTIWLFTTILQFNIQSQHRGINRQKQTIAVARRTPAINITGLFQCNHMWYKDQHSV